ncbi:SDR family oxidoreductase [Bordetella genomosp. 5]|uniref:Short-chain dehydrogenase n=1 Tax=Bordetella genomosp. 5 TaxID=1395608 RepID=A0A261TIF9_9BORD|nr:SDR family oxidoreductase [Bordetella genomosp. 5]OZI49071.1 short-chain dehydrogenase [Bordetella genomosp. 5]
MKIRLKPLKEQVVVITGAGSGIGAATARLAASRGARVVLAGRGEDALNAVAHEIEAQGGKALVVTADVGVEQDHERILEQAMAAFGRVDTWVNNAGVSIFGTLEQVPLADQRKLFDTNYWGVVYGSLTAVRHLKSQGGGALINIGSEVSDRAIPLQGAYSATKHAVKGYTDALRMELQEEGAPISVTLIKPAAVATGYTAHARNYMDVQPQLPPPVYAADQVAQAILHAAEHPVRDMFVGGAARAISALGRTMPGLSDRMAGWLFRNQRGKMPAGGGSDSLFEAGGEHPVDPLQEGRKSAYTQLAMHRGASIVTGVLLVGGAALWALRRR